MLRLLTDMLEKGCSTYHHPMLKLLHKYMKLQDPDNNIIETKKISDSVINVATRQIKVYIIIIIVLKIILPYSQKIWRGIFYTCIYTYGDPLPNYQI